MDLSKHLHHSQNRVFKKSTLRVFKQGLGWILRPSMWQAAGLADSQGGGVALAALQVKSVAAAFRSSQRKGQMSGAS